MHTPRRLAAAAPSWAAPLLVGAAALGACVVVTLVDPNEPGRYPTCPFLAATGCVCPGCGALRAINALAGGRLVEAAGFNVLTVAAIPFLLWRWLRWTVISLGGPALPRLEPRAPAIWVLLGVVVVFGVVRNLPIGAWLAP